MDAANTPEREIQILRKLSHPCIIRLHDLSTYTTSLAIVLDFMAGGDLLERIQKSLYLNESISKCLFYQICRGVEYLHEQQVTHRDLKPDNILLATSDAQTLVRISDFGLSRIARNNSAMATCCGTEIYLAPEVRARTNYTNKVDIWSLGIVLYNCLCGQYPFLADDLVKIVRFQQDIWFDISNDAKMLIRAAIQTNVNKRATIGQILSSPWFDSNDPDVIKAEEIMNNSENYSTT